MKRATVIAAAALVAATAAAAQPGWQHVGTLGQRHLMLVEAAAANDAPLLRQAAATTCVADRPCVVAFWVDPAQVPAAMPMSRVQQQAMVAQYFRNPATGQEELLLKCGPAEAPGSKCLR